LKPKPFSFLFLFPFLQSLKALNPGTNRPKSFNHVKTLSIKKAYNNRIKKAYNNRTR